MIPTARDYFSHEDEDSPDRAPDPGNPVPRPEAGLRVYYPAAEVHTFIDPIQWRMGLFLLRDPQEQEGTIPTGVLLGVRQIVGLITQLRDQLQLLENYDD